jgi:hypothetical protein
MSDVRNPFASLSVVEMLNTLQDKVKVANEKLKAFQDAESMRDKTAKEYSTAVAEVEKLKTALSNEIGNIFPTQNVRQYQ